MAFQEIKLTYSVTAFVICVSFSGSQFEGSALQLPLACGLDPSSGSDSHETGEDDQQRQLTQQLQPLQQQHQSTHRHGTDSSNDEEERKPYDHVMGWNTTEFLAKSVRANNVLGINDSSLGKTRADDGLIK